jgi:hypothetical protein
MILNIIGIVFGIALLFALKAYIALQIKYGKLQDRYIATLKEQEEFLSSLKSVDNINRSLDRILPKLSIDEVRKQSNN